MNYKQVYDKVVQQIGLYFRMTCSPPRLLRYKKRYRTIDKDMYIVLGEEDQGDFLIYSNEERKDIIASLVLPKYKLPLIFDLVQGFEGVCCLCPSLKFLKSYHIRKTQMLRRLIEECDDIVESTEEDLSDVSCEED